MEKNIEKLIKNAKFNLSTEERIKFKEDYSIFLESIKLLDKFDFSNYKKMSRPLENKNNSNILRDDAIIFNNSWRVKKQASLIEGEHIVLREGK